jgi:hypothetical protein
MSYSEPARTAARRTRLTILAALAVVSAALIGVRVYQSLPSSSSSAVSPIYILYGDLHGAPGEAGDDPEPAATPAAWTKPAQVTERLSERRQPGSVSARASAGRGRPPQAPLYQAATDGAVPDGVTVFDDEIPAVANLDLDLLRALRQAATDAADDGVEFYVNSGWRSPEYQEQLLREAVAEYGSEKEAARWVATPNKSAHVSGDAVDIGPSDAAAWLSEHGAMYGLCQIYRNEPWHFELHPEAIDGRCPPMYADPTHDPRMQP